MTNTSYIIHTLKQEINNLNDNIDTLKHIIDILIKEEKNND